MYSMLGTWAISNIESFPYRTARVDALLRLPRDETIFNRLCEKTGLSPDNHVTFEITTKGGDIIGVQFSDECMLIGGRVDRQRW